MDRSEADQDDGEVDTEVRDDILVIRLNRPRKLNAFTPRMLDRLAAAYTELETDAALRCGLLCAEGRAFTGGNQLDKVAPLMAAGGPMFPPRLVNPLGFQGRGRTKPIVTAVQGVCFTVGIELMLATDVVIAASNCRFSQMEVKRGIFANGGATIRMVQRAGWGNAMQLLLTGREFNAQDALRFGLVQEVVETGSEFARALEVAREIAAQAPLAVRATLISAQLALSYGEAVAAADLDQRQEILTRTQDVSEGLNAYLERRPAAFQGR